MEAYNLYLWAVLISLVGCGLSGPVPHDEKNAVAQLKKLASKLQDLDYKNIDTYVGAEQQPHSDTAVQDVPNQSADTEALTQYLSHLSVQDQALLKHMENKLKYLQTAISQPQHGPNPGEEGAVVQAQVKSVDHSNKAKQFEVGVKSIKSHSPSSVPTEQEDEALQNYRQQLTPEEQKLIQKLRYKLVYLQGVLHEPAHAPNPNEAPSVPNAPSIMKKSVPVATDMTGDTPEQDPLIMDYIQNLTPQDQAVLWRHKNELKLLQTILHTAPQGPNPGEDPQAPVPVSKQLPEEVAEEVPEEVELEASILEALQANQAGAGVEQEVKIDSVIFTEADRQMLEAIQVKLDELMAALKTFKKQPAPAIHTESQPQVEPDEDPVQSDEDSVKPASDTNPSAAHAVKQSKSLNTKATQGLNLKQLLKALSQVKKARERRFIDVERELDELTGR